jgi:hypothetical protein
MIYPTPANKDILYAMFEASVLLERIDRSVEVSDLTEAKAVIEYIKKM